MISITLIAALPVAGQEWEQLDYKYQDLSGGEVPHLSVSDDNTRLATYYTFTYAGPMQLSTDGGDTWSDVMEHRVHNVFFHNNDIYAFQQLKEVIYTNGYLYHSSDNGQNWNELYDIPDYVNSAGFMVTDEGEIFMPGVNSMIHSTDQGGNWTTLSVPAEPYSVLETSSGRLIITTYNSGIHYSDDGGNSWTASTGDLGNITFGFLQEHPSNGNLYVASFGGVLESTDNGTSFSLKTPNPWLAMNIAKFEISEGGRFYFYGLYGVYESTDAITWNSLNDGLPAGTMRGMDLSDDHLYVIVDQNIYKRGIEGGSSGVMSRTKETLDLEVFPNPCQGTFRLALESTAQSDAQLTLHDLTGRVVLNASYPTSLQGPSQLIEVDAPSLRNGIYLMTVNYGDDYGTKRIEILK